MTKPLDLILVVGVLILGLLLDLDVALDLVVVLRTLVLGTQLAFTLTLDQLAVLGFLGGGLDVGLVLFTSVVGGKLDGMGTLLAGALDGRSLRLGSGSGRRRAVANSLTVNLFLQGSPSVAGRADGQASKVGELGEVELKYEVSVE